MSGARSAAGQHVPPPVPPPSLSLTISCLLCLPIACTLCRSRRCLERAIFGPQKSCRARSCGVRARVEPSRRFRPFASPRPRPSLAALRALLARGKGIDARGPPAARRRGSLGHTRVRPFAPNRHTAIRYYRGGLNEQRIASGRGDSVRRPIGGLSPTLGLMPPPRAAGLAQTL